MSQNMKALVIAEKPSVGRDIARVLKCTRKNHSSIEGNQYIVTWALGHLVTLAAPEQYNKRYKQWNIEDLPMMPKKMELEVIKQTAKQYQAVKTLLYRKDIKEIIIATDAGREGELVARWILEKANCRKPVRRLWISSVTDKAIREGFARLKPGKDYLPLYDAAVSRAEADWLVGLNATRALTCKYNAQLSCGRVQTPTLAMIAAREEEIRKFTPKPYYGLTAGVKGMEFTWQDKKSGSAHTFNWERIQQILKDVQKNQLKVKEVRKSKKKKIAPALYDLTELQRDANKKFDFSAKETLNIMQRLYENHKVLTYPRTDSRYIGKDIVPTIKERLRACGVGPYKKFAAKCMQKNVSTQASFVNDAKVSDHHAIIPTEQYVQMENMSSEERKIYDLVVRRFLAVLYPPYVYEQTSVTTAAGNEVFTVKGNVVLEAGWREVYDNQEEEDEEGRVSVLPEIKEGMSFSSPSYRMTEGKTKPPSYFNEATLLSAMENPVKFLQEGDRQAAKTLHETGGLGTVATRADIIEKLFTSFLIEKKGKDIHITSKAKQLLNLVPKDLKQPKLTADWEYKLGQIAGGKIKRTAFMSEIEAYTKQVTAEILQADGKFRHDNLTNKECPQCGKKMLSVNGKNSKMLVCQDRECGYRQTISRISNARCPVCHKKMELYGEKGKEVFICGCGHKEKMEKFQERRKKEGAGVSKKDVASYMKKQQQEAKAPINNAFADALKNINLSSD